MLKYDEPLSDFALKLNLRRYSKIQFGYGGGAPELVVEARVTEAGAYTPPLFGST
jgi:hypothetical protein